MKKLIALLLIMVMVIAATACQAKPEAPKTEEMTEEMTEETMEETTEEAMDMQRIVVKPSANKPCTISEMRRSLRITERQPTAPTIGIA